MIDPAFPPEKPVLLLSMRAPFVTSMIPFIEDMEIWPASPTIDGSGKSLCVLEKTPLRIVVPNSSTPCPVSRTLSVTLIVMSPPRPIPA